MLGDSLDEMLNHTCTLVAGKSSTNGYGNELVKWAVADGATEYKLIPCHRIVSPIFIGRDTTGGATMIYYYLYMAISSAPLGFGIPGAEGNYRITDIVTANGTDSGPYDVVVVNDEQGQGHHFRIMLTRTT